MTQPDEPRGAGAVRTARLPGGETLVIRPVEPQDLDAVAELYAGLDTEAAYRRFFSAFRPDHEFFEHLVAVAARGGSGLIAEVDAGPDDHRVVGEAGYELLANGNGELAITVDSAWRGWLGPYLLDALVEVAAAHGVPNLEAEVLLTNGPMLALLRARGYAAVPTKDWCVVRAVIGTTTRQPTWPATRAGLRVLVEGTGGHWSRAEAAATAGLEVLGCAGPTHHAHCPAIAGEPCPLAAGSDVIVLAHPPDAEEWRALRDAHPAVHPGVPICVVLPASDDAARAGETVVEGDADVVAIVQRLAHTRGTDPHDGAP